MVTENIESIIEACKEIKLAGDQILVVRECLVSGLTLDQPSDLMMSTVARYFKESPERVVKCSDTISEHIAKNIIPGNIIIRDTNVSPILAKNLFDEYEVENVAAAVSEISKSNKHSRVPVNLSITKFTIRLYSIVHAAYCVGTVTPHKSQINVAPSTIIRG